MGSPVTRRVTDRTTQADLQVDPMKWAVFMVRSTEGRIFVEGDDGKPMPLDQWRKSAPKPEG